MENLQISEELARLVHLDIDAVLAYDRAIAACGEGLVTDELTLFKLDHQRHVLDLSRAMLELGTHPPEAKPDMKGTILGGVTALRSRLGPEQTLHAMRSNEQLANSTYARALAKPFPETILEIVRRGYADEQRHLSWIERALDQRIWEGSAAHS
jgi:hypothetical protein